jgi:hypothetical protein
MSDLTEDEAKTKWCPMVRLVVAERDGSDGAGVNFNRTAIRNTSEYGTPHAAMCIGAGCMMWRWHEPWTSATEEGVGGDLVLRLSRKPGEPKRGFCGLAGRPE